MPGHLSRGSLCLCIFITLIFLSSCQHSFSDIDAYDQFLRSEDSPYLQEVVRSGAKVSLRYLPTDALLLNQYRDYRKTRARTLDDTRKSNQEKEEILTQAWSNVEKRRGQYAHSRYFALSIGYEDDSKDLVYHSLQAGFGNYSEWLQKLLFGLEEKIYLVDDEGNEIPLGTYHLERSYGMTKNRTLLLVFPERNFPKNGKGELIIDEFGLQTGQLRFELPESQNLVTLNFEK